MATDNKTKIFVGEPRPAEALLGRLENDNATIKGFAEPCQPIGGNQIIPNRSIVWGIRLTKDGKTPTDRLQPNDKNYTGKVKWCKWGTEGGIPITTRYASGCTSIDYDYQVLQLGMKRFEEDIENNYLTLPFGENTLFDSEETRKEMLLTHHENIDSICRNPESMNGSIRLVKKFESTKEQTKNIYRTFDAVSIIRNATTFEHLKVLKTIIADHTDLKYDESNETDLFEVVLLWVNKNSDKFMELMDAYNTRVSDIIERFRSYKAYDWTQNGTLRVGQDKKVIILEGIDAKGEDMVQYLFDKRMEPEVFDAINKMTIIAQNFK